MSATQVDMSVEEHLAEAARVRGVALDGWSRDREGFSGWGRSDLLALAQYHATMAQTGILETLVTTIDEPRRTRIEWARMGAIG